MSRQQDSSRANALCQEAAPSRGDRGFQGPVTLRYTGGMNALRALKLALADVNEALLVLFGAGILGGALSLLLFPLPLVLGGVMRRCRAGRHQCRRPTAGNP